MNNEPVVVEHILNADTKKVWRALTDTNEMKEWYFNISEFKPEVGFEFEFTAGSPEKSYRHLCKVTEVVTEKELSYSWRYDGYKGNSFVTIELFEEDNKTKLKLIHTGLESFPNDLPDFAKESFIKGWEFIIGTSLKNFFEK